MPWTLTNPLPNASAYHRLHRSTAAGRGRGQGRGPGQAHHGVPGIAQMTIARSVPENSLCETPLTVHSVAIPSGPVSGFHGWLMMGVTEFVALNPPAMATPFPGHRATASAPLPAGTSTGSVWKR